MGKKLGKRPTQEYRDYVCKLVVEEKRKISDVSHELELSYSTLCKWVAAYKKQLNEGNPEAEYITPTELEKLKKEYEKKLLNLKEENEILKKAMHIFTKSQN